LPVIGFFAVAIQSWTVFANSSVVWPECVATITSRTPFSPVAARPFGSPAITDLKGSFSFHSGCCGASALTRSIANANCT
jgi:hypothetical protein